MTRRRTKLEIRALRERAWGLSVEGKSQSAIAAELGITQGQVSRLLASARKAGRDALAEEVKTFVVISLQQLELMLDQALRGFERSQRPRRRAASRKDGATEVTEVVVTDSDGDPAWIAEARAIIRFRMELLSDYLPRVAGRGKGKGKDARPDAPGPVTLAGALLEAERLGEGGQD